MPRDHNSGGLLHTSILHIMIPRSRSGCCETTGVSLGNDLIWENHLLGYAGDKVTEALWTGCYSGHWRWSQRCGNDQSSTNWGGYQWERRYISSDGQWLCSCSVPFPFTTSSGTWKMARPLICPPLIPPLTCILWRNLNVLWWNVYSITCLGLHFSCWHCAFSNCLCTLMGSFSSTLSKFQSELPLKSIAFAKFKVSSFLCILG